MNLDDLWASPLNAPAPPERDHFVRQAFDAVRGTQRRRTRFLAWTAAVLSATTAGGAFLLLTGRVDAAGWPPTGLLIAAQWGVFVLILRQWLRAREAAAAPGDTVRESLERLWAEVENTRRRQAAVLALFAVAAPLLGAAILQLRAAGRMASHEAASVAVLFGAVVVGNATAIMVRRYRVVLPRRRRLEELLRQYREE